MVENIIQWRKGRMTRLWQQTGGQWNVEIVLVFWIHLFAFIRKCIPVGQLVLTLVKSWSWWGNVLYTGPLSICRWLVPKKWAVPLGRWLVHHWHECWLLAFVGLSKVCTAACQEEKIYRGKVSGSRKACAAKIVMKKRRLGKMSRKSGRRKENWWGRFSRSPVAHSHWPATPTSSHTALWLFDQWQS